MGAPQSHKWIGTDQPRPSRSAHQRYELNRPVSFFLPFPPSYCIALLDCPCQTKFNSMHGLCPFLAPALQPHSPCSRRAVVCQHQVASTQHSPTHRIRRSLPHATLFSNPFVFIYCATCNYSPIPIVYESGIGQTDNSAVFSTSRGVVAIGYCISNK